MDADFWHKRWQDNDIGFHQHEVNPLLKEYFVKLQLPKGSRVLVPLCGKSHDLSWIAAQGYEVVGIELSELAVKTYFTGLGLEPTIAQNANFTSYRAENIEILVADIFAVKQEVLNETHAIYDRAALVALPEHVRIQYTQHLRTVSGNAPQLLLTYEYDQTLMNGPPFSINENQVSQYYGDNYNISLLKTVEADGRLNTVFAKEKMWLLE